MPVTKREEVTKQGFLGTRKNTPSSRKSLISIYSILGVVANLSLSGSGRKVWWGVRLFEGGRLLHFIIFSKCSMFILQQNNKW